MEPTRTLDETVVKLLLAGVIGGLVLLAGPAQRAWAPASTPAIHTVGLILAKLDETQSPTYNKEGFIDRNGLTDRVIDVLDLMTGPNFANEWCPPMQDIVDRSLEYLLPGSPAQEAFLRDWRRARSLADCII